MELNKIYNENCYSGLQKLADKTIHCCVSSPPYYGLRNYNLPQITFPSCSFKAFGFEKKFDEWTGDLGMEPSPEMFIAHMVLIYEQIRRVLKDDGTCWANMGDSYWGGKGASGSSSEEHLKTRKTETINQKHQCIGKKGTTMPKDGKHEEIKPKDLIGIPWMLAFALREAGWYLRQDIIWNKPNPMPESVTDRCTKAHEYIFLLSKSSKYYFDADSIKKPIAESSINRLAQDIENQEGSNRVPGKINGTMKAVRPNGIVWDRLLNYDSKEKELRPNVKRGGFEKESDLPEPNDKANKKSVWTVTTKPFKEAHFATFPEDLIVDCIKAGSPEEGVVLDPFMGAGTTAVVSKKLNRNYIGFELNPEYIKIAEKRIFNEIGLFI